MGSRLARFIELAERVVYYGAALFLLVTIVMVFLSVIIGLRDVAEAGLLQTALEILDKVLLTDLAIEALHIPVPPSVEKLAASIGMWHASGP